MALLSYEQIEGLLDWLESDEGKAVIATADERHAREKNEKPALSEEDQEPKTER